MAEIKLLLGKQNYCSWFQEITHVAQQCHGMNEVLLLSWSEKSSYDTSFPRRVYFSISDLSQIPNGGSIVLRRPTLQLRYLYRPIRVSQRKTLFSDNGVYPCPLTALSLAVSRVRVLKAKGKSNRGWVTSSRGVPRQFGHRLSISKSEGLNSD